MKLFNFDAVPQNKISEYTSFLSNRAPLTITPVFVEPDYTYAAVTSTIKYNVNQTTLQPADIATFVTTAIQNYSQINLENFKATLLYSRLVEAIDNSHPSIVSNETDYTIMKKLKPSLIGQKNYTINFNIPFDQTLPPQPLVHNAKDKHAVQSSKFLYSGLNVSIEDDGLGTLRIVQEQADGQHHTLVSSGVGTVDYVNGIVTLTGFYTPQYFGDAIRFYVLPANKDNSTAQNVIFEIPNDEIHLNVQIVRQ
jgi:hypothetical protein